MKWGEFDFSALERMTNHMRTSMENGIIEKFMHDFILEVAFRAERKIKPRTPLGETGELRRSWMVGKVERHGNDFVVEIYNNTEYAIFVEYGHRTGKDLTGWVDGRFMMTISMKEIERELQTYYDKHVTRLLDDLMGG
ncbi:phage protein [Paenibacillus sp. L3-i20]|nr:phage protein [Paenibacillus sp. L3-i20]